MRLAALFALPALLSADVLTVTLKPIPAKHTRKIIGRGQAGIWTVMACSDSPKTLTVPRERIMGEALQIPDLPNAMAQDIGSRQIADSPFSFIGGQGDAILANGLENFWSLLKRGLSGTYVSVEPFHLFRYLDEQAFRYNNRTGMNDGDRFDVAVRGIVGKRLMFDQLTGKINTGVGAN